ncbi:MAG: hypothetical protein R3212_07690, partial [Xanthomonadales bacterium]|nr:hypothetical protein [Xanthomonadales bacterium]
TRAVALRLLEDNGVAHSPTVISDLGGSDASGALLKNAIDAAFLIASPSAPVIQATSRTGQVRLLGFERAEAYTRIYPFLSKLVLPEGVLDLARNLPSSDKTLLAPTANLVIRENFHPALVDLLLQAATEIHGAGGLFEQRGEFPAPKYLEFPLSKEAQRYYRRGPPFLQRYLPFWAATFVDRMLVMLIPFLALLIPLSRIVPLMYRWWIRRSIYRWYRDVKAVDLGLNSDASTKRLLEYEQQVDQIEQEVNKISTPLAYSDQLYNLRLHIELVRRKLEQARTLSN